MNLFFSRVLCFLFSLRLGERETERRVEMRGEKVKKIKFFLYSLSCLLFTSFLFFASFRSFTYDDLSFTPVEAHGSLEAIAERKEARGLARLSLVLEAKNVIAESVSFGIA